jgi:dTDP-3-amino-2,3,6-trideoxy-4-keto-D-glucose/dTDP-3-amino-3,4,6-trideoxy-alpha-D-glucose/dTDP-2,6-dideoxy-D-kanosamine transaminase
MAKALAPVPLADPASDMAAYGGAIMEAIAGVIARGTYGLGPQVVAFENEVATRAGVRGAVGVASGTDALALAMLASGVTQGDEVITVSHTAGATVAAIHMVGAVPVLVDIDEETYCLDPNYLDGAVNTRTKAILPVHLYGHPANLESICAFADEHRLTVIEDCAQAQDAEIAGRPVGSIGEIGCFSFYPTKNLGALGDGGLVVSSDEGLLTRLRQLRTYGWTRPQYAQIPHGRCSRLDEVQAAVLRVKLTQLHAALARRREMAQNYRDAFADLPIVCPRERVGACHTYHLYVIRCDRRDALSKFLAERDVATGIHYPYPVHRQPGLAQGAKIPAPLSVTEKISAEILSLPLYPSLTVINQQRVIDAVRSFFGRRHL